MFRLCRSKGYAPRPPFFSHLSVSAPSFVKVTIGSSWLDVLLSLVPVWDPAPSPNASASVGVRSLGRGSVAGSAARPIQFLRLVCELILIQDAALLVAQLLRLRPGLLLSGCKEACSGEEEGAERRVSRACMLRRLACVTGLTQTPWCCGCERVGETIHTVEYNTAVVNKRGDQKHTLPLLPRLSKDGERKERSQTWKTSLMFCMASF